MADSERPSPGRSADRSSGVFSRAYTRGITDELPPPTPTTATADSAADVSTGVSAHVSAKVSRARSGAPGAGTSGPDSHLSLRGRTMAAATGEAFALRGAVITPDAAWDDGYVVIDGDTIADTTRTPPTGVAQILDTGGVILPGLIDLHGHPEFNVFPAWEPPRTIRQPLPMAGQRPLPPAGPRPAKPASAPNFPDTHNCATQKSAPSSAASPHCKAPPTSPAAPTPNPWSATSTNGSSDNTGPAP